MSTVEPLKHFKSNRHWYHWKKGSGRSVFETIWISLLASWPILWKGKAANYELEL